MRPVEEAEGAAQMPLARQPRQIQGMAAMAALLVVHVLMAEMAVRV